MADDRKVVVVTGASHGLGEAFVKTYRERGWCAVGNARTIAPSDDPDYITVTGDVGDPAIARKVVNTAIERFGRVDTLINNAGIWRPGRIEDISEALYREVQRTNLDSVFFATQAAVRAMKKQGAATSSRFRRVSSNTRCRRCRRCSPR
jgi:NAD(P)-dependent dehydrogenase (short-subunit alcohol dehydrogenase family)